MKLPLQFLVRGLMVAGLFWVPQVRLAAKDFILTIGGGYRPESSQASLEANVLFFEQILQTEHNASRRHDIFFANGDDPEPDLQVLAEDSQAADNLQSSVSTGAVTRLLEDLYGSSADDDVVVYRKHEIENVSGPNLPANIRASLRQMCDQMAAGDRLLVYVTAHGGEAKGRNRYNTSISCWDDQSITASEFARWLDEVPPQVPVIMVMAQCYCGGFAHTIFRNAQRTDGLSKHLRVGFFAQQHDLPAAGCRPDIDNDEEYSSFFWGAFINRSRNGTSLISADFNLDGQVSFAEAHAQAVLTSQTIDIPLRSSEALLRAYSRIGGGYDHRRDQDGPGRSDEQSISAGDETDNDPTLDGDASETDRADRAAGNIGQPAAAAANEVWLDSQHLASMTGTLGEVVHRSEPELQRTVAGLAQQLNLNMLDDVPSVFEQFEQQRDSSRQLRRSASRNRRRGGSGRRQLRTEITQQWPELTADDWRTSQLLQQSDQSELMQQIAQLPNYHRFTEGLLQRRKTQQELEQAELREVKFQRLINTLEAIVLARNLHQVADADVVARYQAMLAIEQTGLSDR